MKILITGANGYVARSLAKSLSGYNIITKTRQELDITNSEEVDKFFANNNIDYIIHTATKGGKRTLPDTQEVYDTDLAMFNNLAKHSDSYKRMFVFGSGAEFTLLPHFYGKVKKEITKLASKYKNITVLRLYGCFGELEEPQRFFKNNISKYFNKENMEVHNNIYMDFFYDKDIATIIKMYFTSPDLPPVLDLTYSTKYTLGELTQMINLLDKHKVEVTVGDSNNNHYISNNKLPKVIEQQLVGLYDGLKATYNTIINE